MSKKFQSVRGMNDLIPSGAPLWQQVEQVLIHSAQKFGYHEIRFPILEKTELFKRSIGEVTDIVEKEMYTFLDRNEESLTMRPEGTACCVRAGIQQGLLHNQIQKLWYMGPMFRYEKPQKGRLRQFHQFGVEAFGIDSALIDAELIVLAHDLLVSLGLKSHITLQINSLGSLSDRENYKAKLVDYLTLNKSQMDEDSIRRLSSNPLRILDSKSPDMAELIAGAPALIDHLSEQSKARFENVKAILDNAGITYTVNSNLVRGLDYYNDLVFEWVTDSLGAQGTVCAGGRYNRLVSDLGGSETPAVGFAIGIERLTALVELFAPETIKDSSPDGYMIALGEAAQTQALKIVATVRAALPEKVILLDTLGGNLKKQMKRADKSNARYAILFGDDELSKNELTVKDLTGQSEQKTMPLEQAIALLGEMP